MRAPIRMWRPMAEQIFLCPARGWYTRQPTCLTTCKHIPVDDLYAVDELPWPRLAGDLYRERWVAGHRPQSPGPGGADPKETRP